MAQGQKREYERPAQAVPAQGHRHLELLTSQAQCCSEAIEREAKEDTWLPDAGSDVQPHRCVDRLNPPLIQSSLGDFCFGPCRAALCRDEIDPKSERARKRTSCALAIRH